MKNMNFLFCESGEADLFSNFVVTLPLPYMKCLVIPLTHFMKFAAIFDFHDFNVYFDFDQFQRRLYQPSKPRCLVKLLLCKLDNVEIKVSFYLVTFRRKISEKKKSPLQLNSAYWLQEAKNHSSCHIASPAFFGLTKFLFYSLTVGMEFWKQLCAEHGIRPGN